MSSDKLIEYIPQPFYWIGFFCHFPVTENIIRLYVDDKLFRNTLESDWQSHSGGYNKLVQSISVINKKVTLFTFEAFPNEIFF